MKMLKEVIARYPIFSDLAPEDLELIAGCAKNVVFQAKEMVFKHGQDAEYFYMISHGRVALEIHVPHRGPLVVETIEDGSPLGWSWLFPPYKCHFDARALTLTRAVALESRCLREKSEVDVELGYRLMSRFGQVMLQRLQAVQLQLIDFYQNPSETSKR